MEDINIISWLFLATALATQTKTANIIEISSVADGINHSIPTKNEIQKSISWLIKESLISKHGKKYGLTFKGKIEYDKASKNTKTVIEIWKNIELNLRSKINN